MIELSKNPGNFWLSLFQYIEPGADYHDSDCIWIRKWRRNYADNEIEMSKILASDHNISELTELNWALIY